MELMPATNNRITVDFIDLTNDGSIFLDDHELEILSEELEITILNRLVKWCSFFEENRGKCIGIYEQMMHTLIEAAKTNRMFRTQTQHEFKLSLMFYAQIMASRKYMQLDKPEDARLLLNVSLIFGKYPGMLVRSLKKTLDVLIVKLDGIKFLFKELFVKYEAPLFLTQNIHLLDEIEIDALMYILQGNNIRYFDKLPYPISKRESHFFMNNVRSNLSENNILARGILFSKILIVNPNYISEISIFLSCNRVYLNHLDVLYRDLDYWKRAFKILCGVRERNIVPAYHPIALSTLEYVDFFVYKKYIENINYSLKGRTAQSITQAVADWHDSVDFPETQELLKLSWGTGKNEEINIKHKSGNFSIKEMIKGEELFRESKELKHCVFSYVENCAKGYTSVWSMKKEIKGEYKSFITIEVEKQEIIQVAGKHNRELTLDELIVVELWAEKMSFKFKKYDFQELN